LPATIASAANASTMGKQAFNASPQQGVSFKPYVYVMPGPSADSKPSSIIETAQQTGVKDFTLAFIISQGCQAIWGDFTQPGKLPLGIPPGTPDPMMTAITQLRQMGGDVTISFGGANGTELGQACQDAASLQKQYQSVIDAYKVNYLDFDIEGASVADTASIDRRNKAIAALEHTNPNLCISYTLPVMPTGLTADGVNILKNAHQNGVQVCLVNIMTMDYGASVPPNQMGKAAISAAQATEKQITSIGLSAKIGITPMIGLNDTMPETFTTDDARQVLDFAKQTNYIGSLSMWSLGRDKPCPGGATNSVSPTCSSLPQQQKYDFVKILGSFEGPLKPLAPPPSGTPPSIPPKTQQNAFFPCSDVSIKGRGQLASEPIISKDWLSGNGGRFVNTYAADTYAFKPVTTLFGYMEAIGFTLIIPSILLLGYEIMLGASTFRYAGALEGLPRVFLGGAAVVVSFTLVQLLIHLENSLTTGIVLLHTEQPFPRATVGGIPVAYKISGEPAVSYRGIVVPMSRWGCAMNDFTGIFSPNLVGDLASNIPILNSFVHLAGTVTNMANLIARIGTMTLTVLSMLLWVQVFVRILLLNYYILMAPLAFGCWALPGGVGPNVVRLWSRGFLSMLFVQTIQLFILTTMPLLLPPLPQTFASIGGEGILETILLQFPPIMTLCVVLMAPTFVGASITKALGAAGSVTREVVVAVGTGVKTSRDSVRRRRDVGTEEIINDNRWALTRKARAKAKAREEIINDNRWALTRKARAKKEF
jgi:chitinase